jgi:hypothetical protein
VADRLDLRRNIKSKTYQNYQNGAWSEQQLTDFAWKGGGSVLGRE